MEKYLKVKIRDKNYGIIISLTGRLDIATRKKLDFVLKELVLEKACNIGLDLKHLEYLDAKGLSVITTFHNTLKKKKIALYAYGMNSDVYNILDFVDAAVGIKMLKNEKEFKNRAMEKCS